MLSTDKSRNVSDIQKYQHCWKQQKLQLGETFRSYEPASHSDFSDKMR